MTRRSAVSRQSIEERQTTVAGIEIEYLVAGSDGPPVVLLHGDLDDARTWSGLLSALATRCRVYAPSLPGYGRSGKPKADYSPGFLARVMAAFLDSLHLSQPVLIGHSLGGLVALEIALDEPSRPSGLVLIASGGLGRAVHPALLAEAWPGVGELITWWSKSPFGTVQHATAFAALGFAHFDRVPPDWLNAKFRLLREPGLLEASLAAKRSQMDWSGQRNVLLDRLPDVDVPALVIWGRADRMLPLAQGRAAAMRLSRGRLVAVPDAGHFVHLEQPDAVLEALRDFLDDVLVARGEPLRHPRKGCQGRS